MSMAEKSPAERAAAAQKLHDEGDPRPVSQIEGEMLAQEQAGQPVTSPEDRDDAALGDAARGGHASRDQAARDEAARIEEAKGEKESKPKPGSK